MFSRLQRLDNRVLENISRIHRPKLNRIMVTASRLGNAGIVWWAVCLPFLIIPRWRYTGLTIIFALGLTSLMGEGIIKHTVKRVRPCHSLDEEEQLIKKPKYYSFPSGHTASSFSVVSVAIFSQCPVYVIIPIALVASIIAFSRVYLRVHYLTDVLVGFLLGMTCGAITVLLMNAIVPKTLFFPV
ncbi:MAG TPA: phosphatase PAP2 family protein [Ruminococcaceae bacterium]|nr:phosphatase PAP2 family protein [Oscillospiraceae bacterium]